MTAVAGDSDATLSASDFDALVTRTLAELPRERVDVLSQTIAKNPRATIQPGAARSDALGRAALAELGAAGAAGDLGERVVLERTLGEGGMGVVRLATQRSLGRKVAVKTLKPEAHSEQAVLRLLREAWVTGALEHPNIVPVHDLGLDEHGAPIIVLKRIEGEAWSELIGNADALRARFGGTDLLEQNLRILVQLCHAVALAHARGILHRDLKPENVMIGSFGEVYLVDWGIAASLREDPSGRLPVGTASQDLAGTPVYMAPEMLGIGPPLSERTDVYLLGAILHEILTGRPPHHGADFRAIVASILRPRPVYPETAPRELVAIAQKAMGFEAGARFASADELRARLEWYLRHRGSLALSDEAGRSLARLRERAAGDDAAAAREIIYRSFVEARFGFRQALAASPDNDVAAAGLRDATELVVAWELAHGTADAAAAALAELPDPPADVAERVEVARRAQAERAARLAVLEREHDPSVGRRTRAFVALVLGVLWTVVPLVLSKLEARAGHRLPPGDWYGVTIVQAALTFALGYWARDSLSKSLVNRRVVAGVRLTFAAQLVLELVAATMGMDATIALVLHVFVWFVMASAFSVFADPRLWPSAVGYLVGLVVAAARPELVWWVASLGNLVLLVNATSAWRASGDLEAAAQRLRGRGSRSPAGDGRPDRRSP